MALDLALRLPGFEAGLRLVDSLADKLDALATKLEAVTAGAEKLGTVTGGSGTGGNGGGGGGRSSGAKLPKEPKEPRFVGGANQRLLQIEEQRVAAQGIQDAKKRTAVLEDLDAAETRARRAIVLNQRRKAQGDKYLQGDDLLQSFEKLNSFLKAMLSGNVVGAAKSAISFQEMFVPKPGGLNVAQKTARTFNAPPVNFPQAPAGAPASVPDLGEFLLPGGDLAKGVESLAGATEGAAAGAETLGGLLGVAGPIAIAVGVTALSLKLFSESVTRAADRLKGLADAITLGGGKAQDVTGLRSFGITPNQAAALAKAFRESISAGSGNPMAMVGASRLGIDPQLPRELGGTGNELELLNRALERLADLPEAERRSVARQNPIFEQFLPRMEAMNRNRGSLEADRRAENAISRSNPGALRGAQDLALAGERVSNAFDRIFTSLGAPVLEAAAWWTNRFADGLTTLSEMLATDGSALVRIINALNAPLGNLLQGMTGFYDLAQALGGHRRAKGETEPETAQDRVHGALGKLGSSLGKLGAAVTSPVARIGNAFNRIAAAFGKMTGGTGGGVLDLVAGGIERFAGFLERAAGWISQAFERIGAMFRQFIEKLPGGKQLLQGADALFANDPTKDLKAAQQAHAEALKAHTDAMHQHTLALRGGTYGGGDRIRGAVPSALKGSALKRATENQMLRELGAFSF